MSRWLEPLLDSVKDCDSAHLTGACRRGRRDTVQERLADVLEFLERMFIARPVTDAMGRLLPIRPGAVGARITVPERLSAIPFWGAMYVVTHFAARSRLLQHFLAVLDLNVFMKMRHQLFVHGRGPNERCGLCASHALGSRFIQQGKTCWLRLQPPIF